MENIRSYEDMENYVRKVIYNSWDFLFSCKGNMYMYVSIEGTHERYVSYARWFAGDKAEEETKRKAVLEAEYMAVLDDPETEDNIKKLAADLWKQWKEYELDE